MKKILTPLTLFLLVCLCACQDKQTQESPVEETPVVETPMPEPEPPTENLNKTDNILGSYVGAFRAQKYDADKAPSYSNRINISIDRLDENKVFGHSVVAGNIRPFEGTYTVKEDGSFDFQVQEPGDDRYDGKFTFTVDLNKPKSLRGKWTANDTKLAVSVREYGLEKKSFSYNPDYDLPEAVTMDGLYATWEEEIAESLTSEVTELNASKAVLKKEDVENLYKGDLEFIRNAVYARHGYSFKNRRVRYVFDNYVDWYIPHSTDIRDQLTDIEKENIELLKRYEQHANEYYDSFGR